MLGGLFQSTILLWTAITFYIIDFVLIRRYDKQRKSTSSARSWDYTLYMFLGVVVIVAQPLIFPGLSIMIHHPMGLAVQAVGICLVCLSLYLNVWARKHLQQFYAERVEVQPEHSIIESGPYAYIRHPVFTSLFGLVIGLMLINPSLPTLLLAVYTFWDFTRAARQEEALLARNLPGYKAYIARTNAFIPNFKRFKRV
ncbi:MAG: isoprenylcysteine carboxylmethyltransferase family protein [Anaerolineaceae bacterium]|jgi:protein-S-isoprenylcysteine O-methyltransferase